MQILQLMKWLSPKEDTGGKIRSFQIGRALASFAQVDAAGFVLPGEEPDGREDPLSPYRRLYPIPICRNGEALRQILNAFAGGFSLRTSRFFPGVYASCVDRILRENRYDAVQAEELPAMSSMSALSHHLPIVFSSYNVESELSFRLFHRWNPLLKVLANMEYRRTAQEEKNALNRAQACLVVSERDRDMFKRLSPEKAMPIHVLPNCAQDRFQPASPNAPEKGILTVGSFGWYPNRDGLLWFTEEVLPLLRKRSPALTVQVVGSGISPQFHRKLKRQGMDIHTDMPDILPFLQEARLLFVPLRIGGGTRIKILEAWAAGLPVVSTAVGAEGLPCRTECDILIADGAAEFAAAIHRILNDDGLYRRLRAEGHKKAQDFRWSSLISPLAEVYKNVLTNGKAEYR